MEFPKGVTQLDTLKRCGVKLFKKLVVPALYNGISSLDSGSNMLVLNYGYDDGQEIPLDSAERPLRYRLAMYHHVVNAVDIFGKDVLEVSSGRGGGAAYIARHFQLRSLRGIDLSPKAVQFCRTNYSVPRLAFSVGDAENLDSKDSSYDVVINIEASHNYPDQERFFREVYRVLRPGGFFLYADLRYTDKMAALRNSLASSGLIIVKEEDITANVLSALNKDNDYKKDVIESRVPRFVRGLFATFAGMKGTRFYKGLQSGDLSYFNLLLQKE